MAAAPLRSTDALRQLLTERFPDARPLVERDAERLARPIASGIGVLDAALPGGGFPRGKLSEVLSHAGLLRLDAGVFILHAVQLAMWVAIPALLVQAGLDKQDHWWVYLPAVLASFVVMAVTLLL